MAKIETPTDSPTPSSNSTGKVPQRGIRKRVLGAGEGDYCVMQIAESKDFPEGTLLLIPGVDRFETAVEAKRWCESTVSGDTLAGKKLMIIKVCDMGHGRLKSEPQFEMEWRPKIAVQKATAETAE